MNRYIIDEFYRDPGLHQRLSANARREQAKALRAAFNWLREKLTGRSHARHWLARIG